MRLDEISQTLKCYTRGPARATIACEYCVRNEFCAKITDLIIEHTDSVRKPEPCETIKTFDEG